MANAQALSDGHRPHTLAAGVRRAACDQPSASSASTSLRGCITIALWWASSSA